MRVQPLSFRKSKATQVSVEVVCDMKDFREQQECNFDTIRDSLTLNNCDMAVNPWIRVPAKILKFKKKSAGALSSSAELNQVTFLFYPMRLILHILGRFPFCPGQGYLDNSNELSQPSLTYDYSMYSIHWLYFIVTSLILLFILVLTSMGFARAYLEWEFPIRTYPSFNDYERIFFKKNLVPFVLVWSCLVLSNVGDISFILNRKRVVDYLNEWEKMVRILKVELPVSLRTFLIVSNLCFFCFLIVILIIQSLRILPIARGGAEVITILVIKPFIDNDTVTITCEWIEQNHWLNNVGSGITIYSLYASRALLFIYAYKCRLLRFGFKSWNSRLKEQLSHLQSEHDASEFVQCETLYSQHTMMIKMIRRTDKVFGGILQAYYAIQILNTCFELYYLARSGKFRDPEGDDDDNGLDVAFSMVLLMQNISVFFTVSLEAAHVHDEAHRGHEFLLARGLQRYDSTTRKLLIRNLLQSYSNGIFMTGGKFFTIDRPFIIKVLGAVFTYFVIILQLGDRIYPAENN